MKLSTRLRISDSGKILGGKRIKRKRLPTFNIPAEAAIFQACALDGIPFGAHSRKNLCRHAFILQRNYVDSQIKINESQKKKKRKRKSK